MTDHHWSRILGPHQPRECGAEIGNQRLVDLFADQPAYVVSLDNAVHSRGGPRHARAPDNLDFLRLLAASLSARERRGPNRSRTAWED
ncbi:hypothetical protein FJ05194_2020 [Mycobacterium tuberculosis FJ05194]|nr:hypothetical protein FJ05194_2020 [Mycobacterium tuberculosis FJ05194]